VFTLWLVDGRQHDSAFAQGSKPAAGPVFPAPAGTKPQPAAKPAAVQTDVTAEEAINVAVYDRVNRSVVNITTKSGQNFLFLEGSSEGSGSGCVLDKQGHILTNFHVIEEARTASVTLYNGKSFEASLVGADPYSDLVVLKIDAPKELLHPVEVGDSRRLRVGMRVFAIGNPFGLERTMTTGIISSVNRSLKLRSNRTIRSIIQIDAAVNPGNSGGPLLDTRGRLIGINTAIATRTGQSAGVGFAIPASLIARVTPQLIKHGRVIRPEIGIRRVYETDNGLLIASLSPNGPAATAGLRGPRITRTRRGIFVIERLDRSAADLITAVDGKPVKTADDFLDQIESKKPGSRVTLTIIRGGKKENVRLTLGRH
jgi:S1-C subfamily serine protease